MARVVRFAPLATSQAQHSVEREFREFMDQLQPLALEQPAVATFVLRWMNEWIREWRHP